MNINEHILTVGSEECLEIAKEISKALRFGLDDKLTMNPEGPRGTDGPTNREKIVMELNDLMGVVRLMEARGIIPKDWANRDAQTAKQTKVMKFMEYAERVGALNATLLTDAS